MKKFEVTLSVKPEVTIHNPEKLESAVCNKESDFCKSFYTYSDIADFVDSFSLQFYYEHKNFEKRDGDSDYSYYKFVEGYGDFKEVSYNKWVLISQRTIDEMGLIEVYLDNDGDLEVEWSASEVKCQ